MHGRGESPPASQEDHRPGPGHRPHGGRGRALRGHSGPDQRGQVRPPRVRQGGAGGAYPALRAGRHPARGRGQDHRELHQGGGAVFQYGIRKRGAGGASFIGPPTRPCAPPTTPGTPGLWGRGWGQQLARY